MSDAAAGTVVLYLDDEESLVFLVTRLLERLGYEACGFTSAEEALAAFKGDPARYSLVLTDLSMPGSNGLEFARDVLAVAPGSKVAILSGNVEEADVMRARALGVRAVIQKPHTLAELGPVVQQLLR
ncbi:MAG TPA: response regulator [Steroidobacteraceae bacterium]